MKQIYLTQGKVALVDDENYNDLIKHLWYYNVSEEKYGYAARKADGNNQNITMHQEIIGLIPKGFVVKHIDGNGLNNQKYNLKLVTRVQVSQFKNKKQKGNSSSKYKGVTYHKQGLKWRARICVNGLNISLGLYSNEIEAAEAYDSAAKLYFGEFARLNFPDKVLNQSSNQSLEV